MKDPERESLKTKFEEVLHKAEKPKRKIIVFTEYVDTVLHLKHYFEKASNRILFCDGSLNKTFANVLNQNFNAKAEIQSDDYDILITSDKLSEGFNLNRAGAIINYDIPWNRHGLSASCRINRMSVRYLIHSRFITFFPPKRVQLLLKVEKLPPKKCFLSIML